MTKKEHKTERFGVRVPERLGQTIRDEAKKLGVKPSVVIRWKLEQRLKDVGEEVTNMEEQLTVTAAAEATGYSPKYLRELIALGDVQASKHRHYGRQWLIPRSEVKRLVRRKATERRGRPKAICPL